MARGTLWYMTDDRGSMSTLVCWLQDSGIWEVTMDLAAIALFVMACFVMGWWQRGSHSSSVSSSLIGHSSDSVVTDLEMRRADDLLDPASPLFIDGSLSNVFGPRTVVYEASHQVSSEESVGDVRLGQFAKPMI